MDKNKQDRIQEINETIVSLEGEMTGGVNTLQTQQEIKAKIENLQNERSELEKEIFAAEQAERAQQIEDKVASIELPYDFNDLYENSTANATIIEIVQQFKRQDLVEHNAEIEKLTQLHKEQLSEQMRAANDRESQLQRQNKELQNDLQENVAAQKATEEENASLKLQLKESNFTKYNAATQLEEANAEIARLKSHIDDLVKEQAIGAREAHKVIETNQTLNELIERGNAEKQAKIKSSSELAAEGALGFRGKVELPSLPQQELPFQGTDTTGTTSNQLPATYEASPVEGPQFQTVTAPIVGPIAIPGQQHNGEVAETAEEGFATQGWVKAEIARAIADIRGE